MENSYLRTCATLDRNVFPPVRTQYWAQSYFGSLSAVSTIPLTRSKMTLGESVKSGTQTFHGQVVRYKITFSPLAAPSLCCFSQSSLIWG